MNNSLLKVKKIHWMGVHRHSDTAEGRSVNLNSAIKLHKLKHRKRDKTPPKQ